MDIQLSMCVTFTHTDSIRQATSNIAKTPGTAAAEMEPVSILHPDVPKVESLIRNAWADSNLVAD